MSPVEAQEDARGAKRDFVAAADLDRAGLRVSLSPAPTLLTVVRDALQGGRRGMPAQWRSAALSQLRGRDLRVLATLADPAVTSYPSLLEPVATCGAREEPLTGALERLSAAGGPALVRALDHSRDVSPAPAWERVKGDPDRWLAGYVDALHRCWPAVEPLWERSRALLEREEDRLGAILAAGVTPTQALVEMSPRMTLVGDRLYFAPGDTAPRRLGVSEDGATVVPMVVSSRAGTVSAPGADLDWVGYPLPESWRAFDGVAPTPARLDALLGAQRATLLRSLDGPRTAGQLARLLDCAPSVVTHHLRTLERAGLIDRRREGRHVLVHRTSRGSDLLALYP